MSRTSVPSRLTVTAVTPPPRLYRAPEHRMAAGVAAGIADHLGISVLRVRVAFMVLLGLRWVVQQHPAR